MFSNTQEKKTTEEISNSSSIIGKGTSLEGDIETFGNIRIEGSVKGNVTTKAKTAHGQSSYVEGKILAQNAEIAGEINGSLEIAELLILRPTAVINGDVVTNKMIVESGAVLNGTCKMGVTSKEIKISGEQKSERPGGGAPKENNKPSAAAGSTEKQQQEINKSSEARTA